MTLPNCMKACSKGRQQWGSIAFRSGLLFNGNFNVLDELEKGTRHNPDPGCESLYVKYEQTVLL